MQVDEGLDVGAVLEGAQGLVQAEGLLGSRDGGRGVGGAERAGKTQQLVDAGHDGEGVGAAELLQGTAAAG